MSSDDELRSKWAPAVKGIARSLGSRYRRDWGEVENELWIWVYRNRASVTRHGPIPTLLKALYGYGDKRLGKEVHREQAQHRIYSDKELGVLLEVTLDQAKRAKAKGAWEQVFQRAQRALESLAEGDQVVLTLRHGDGLRVEESAGRMGVSTTVVSDRYQRAMGRLQDAFEAPDDEDREYEGTRNMGHNHQRAPETTPKKRSRG